jgi:hypothetical protein
MLKVARKRTGLVNDGGGKKRYIRNDEVVKTFKTVLVETRYAFDHS